MKITLWKDYDLSTDLDYRDKPRKKVQEIDKADSEELWRIIKGLREYRDWRPDDKTLRELKKFWVQAKNG